MAVRPAVPLEQVERYAFANLGRNVSRQTVREAWHTIATRPDFKRTVLGLNEIGEADKGYDDHALMRGALNDTHAIVHGNSREPIAVPSARVYGLAKSVRGCPGVPRQSPPRRIQEVVVDGRLANTAVLCLHPPAGAHNGKRGRIVKRLLVAGWALIWRKLKRRVKHHLEAGRHVVILMDANRRDLPQLHRRQIVAQHHGPDYIIVIPARGFEADVTKHNWTRLPIEGLHGLLTATITYREAKP